MKKFLKNFIKRICTSYSLKLINIEHYRELLYRSKLSKNLFSNYDLFIELTKIIELDSKVNGVYVECGFGYGKSFSILGHLANKYNRKIYGIDSFSGFPKITENDLSQRDPKQGEWNTRSCEDARKFVKSLKIFDKEDRFDLIKVIFEPDAKNPIPNEKISLLHLDLDLYEGYKYALEMFWDQVSIGGIIIFDEYKNLKWPGATKAINEVLTQKRFDLSKVENLNNKFFIRKI